MASETTAPPPSIAADDIQVSCYLGKGAYAYVYKAVWQGRQVAIKAVPVKDYGGTAKIVMEGPDTRFGLQSFVHEAVLLHQLSHRNIVKVHGMTILPKSAFNRMQGSEVFKGCEAYGMVQDLCKGKSLASMMMEQMIAPSTVRYSPEEALQWCLDIASALSHLHSRRRLIIHRDLKLENILLHQLDSGGLTAIVADFGLGAYISDQGVAHSAVGLNIQQPDGLQKSLSSLLHTQRSDDAGYAPAVYLETASSDAYTQPLAGLLDSPDGSAARPWDSEGLPGLRQGAATSDAHPGAHPSTLASLTEGPPAAQPSAPSPLVVRPSLLDKQAPALASAAAASPPALTTLSAIHESTSQRPMVSAEPPPELPPRMASALSDPGSAHAAPSPAPSLGPAASDPTPGALTLTAQRSTSERMSSGQADAALAALPSAALALPGAAGHEAACVPLSALPAAATSSDGQLRSAPRAGAACAEGSDPAAAALPSAADSSLGAIWERMGDRKSVASVASAVPHRVTHPNAAHSTPLPLLSAAGAPRAASATYAAGAPVRGPFGLRTESDGLGALSASILASRSVRGVAAPGGALSASRRGVPGLDLNASHRLTASQSQRLTGSSTLTRSLSSAKRGLSRVRSSLRGRGAREERTWALTGHTGSTAYMAPEVMRNETYNEKVDIYSFGVVCFELFARQRIVARMEGLEELNAYGEAVTRGHRPPFPACFPPELRALIASCWEHDPQKRLGAKELVSRLATLKSDKTLAGIFPSVQRCSCIG